jgi:8-hydroxy-5-deazaflavin:NADPH oxidoreductase
VADLLAAFGWEPEQVIDLGGIEAARGTEMYLALWLRTMSAAGNPFFNVRLVRGD